MMEGGCLCGALRYRVDAEPLDTGYCHCTMCRRSTGAPVLAWASVPAAAFAYTEGQPTVYLSSSWGQREFCAGCGAQICYRDQGSAETPKTVEINSGCLDDPAAAPPRHHIYDADRIPWFETADALPRYAGAKPGDEPI
jgi:hypothetical protein